jgi:hypothetical protein
MFCRAIAKPKVAAEMGVHRHRPHEQAEALAQAHADGDDGAAQHEQGSWRRWVMA